MPEPAQSIRTLLSETNCSLQEGCPRDINERNWCQHLKSSMEDTTILSITARITSDVFAILTSHKQAFKIPDIHLSRTFPFSLAPAYRHGAKHVYHVMLTFPGHLVTPFSSGFMSIRPNIILICHLSIMSLLCGLGTWPHTTFKVLINPSL